MELFRAKKEAELEKRFSGIHLDSEQAVTEQKNITDTSDEKHKRAEEELKVLTRVSYVTEQKCFRGDVSVCFVRSGRRRRDVELKKSSGGWNTRENSRFI